jgi:hypothetical protein
LDTVPQFPAFRGKKWKVKRKGHVRPFLPAGLWRKVKRQALKRASERKLNPRTRRQRQELFAFTCLCVGGALRPDEAYSLRWKDCRLGKLKKDKTECVYIFVHGKHTDTEDGTEEGWLLYDGVQGSNICRRSIQNAAPEDKLFTEKHPDGLQMLLESCDPPLRHDVVTGVARSSRSLRSTGISLRLEEGPDPSYNDIAA